MADQTVMHVQKAVMNCLFNKSSTHNRKMKVLNSLKKSSSRDALISMLDFCINLCNSSKMDYTQTITFIKTVGELLHYY